MITDDHGIVLNSNTAADRLLGRPVLGKPIAGRFATDHRRAVRTLITRSRISADVLQLRADVPGAAESVEVQVRVFTDPLTGRRRLRWRFTPKTVPTPPTVLSLVRPVATRTADRDGHRHPDEPAADDRARGLGAAAQVEPEPAPQAARGGRRARQRRHRAAVGLIPGPARR